MDKELKPAKLMNKYNPEEQIGYKCPHCNKVSEFEENIIKHMEEKHSTNNSLEEK